VVEVVGGMWILVIGGKDVLLEGEGSVYSALQDHTLVVVTELEK
jgi:hypothetical protein